MFDELTSKRPIPKRARCFRRWFKSNSRVLLGRRDQMNNLRCVQHGEYRLVVDLPLRILGGDSMTLHAFLRMHAQPKAATCICAAASMPACMHACHARDTSTRACIVYSCMPVTCACMRMPNTHVARIYDASMRNAHAHACVCAPPRRIKNLLRVRYIYMLYIYAIY